MDLIVSINGPEWFQTFDAVFQILFALVTIAISVFGYKVFHFAKDTKFKYFSLSFLLLALGFLTVSFSNLLIYLGVYDGILSSLGEFNVGNAFFLASMLFILFGFMLLIIVSMNLKQKRLVALLLAIVLLFVAFSYQYYLKFHMVALLLLGFIAWQFYDNYAKKKNTNAGLVFAGFYVLAFAEVFFLTMVYMPLLFVLANILQALGFGLLLAMLLRVLYGRKKK